MTAHIICQNDWQHAAVIDDLARATRELERLAREAYDQGGKWDPYGRGQRSYAEYRRLVRWHVRSVRVL
jgi:hypothetical protein